MPPGLSLEGLKYKSLNLTLQKVEEQHVPAIATARVVIPSPCGRICAQVEKLQGSPRSFVERVLRSLRTQETLPLRICSVREKHRIQQALSDKRRSDFLLTTPLGTVVAIPMIYEIDQMVLGALLALSSGALVYVGATHLLPLAEREEKPYSLAAMAGGVVVALGIILTHV